MTTSVLAFSTTTATAPVVAPQFVMLVHGQSDLPSDPHWYCPGSNGEISSSSCRAVYGDRCFCW